MFRRQILADPRNYIAQPVVPLSRVPSYDLAEQSALPDGMWICVPYCLYDGQEVTIVPGGLTRVALQAGIAGGEFLSGRRQQGYLGPAGRGMKMLSRIGDSLFWLGALH